MRGTVSEIARKSVGYRSFGYEWFDHLESTAVRAKTYANS
jgi:hypothetical protein